MSENGTNSIFAKANQGPTAEKPKVVGESATVTGQKQAEAEAAPPTPAPTPEPLPNTGVGAPAFGSSREDGNVEIQTDAELESLQDGAEQQTQLSESLNRGNEALQNLEGQAAAANQPSGSTTYTSHPIGNFKLGRFQFEKGQLVLDADDAAEFDKLLADKNLAPQDRNLVKKIDAAAGDAIARQYLESKRVRGTDTSADRPGA